MRFNTTATLYLETAAQDDAGNTVRSKGAPKEVYANRYEIGLNAFIAARDSGLHADAEMQLRTADYGGENVACFDGVEYTVERASDSGEFTRLVLARRLSNDR